MLYRQLTRQYKQFHHSSGYDQGPIKTILKGIALSGYRSYSPTSMFSNEEFKLLKSHPHDNTIVIMKPDKGNGVVILNKTDYIAKMNEILQDTDKFAHQTDDPIKTTMKRETEVRKFLKTLKKNKVISDEQYRKLSPIGSHPGIMYGLPKVHKPNAPLRPMLSAIGTPTYKIAKFLIPLLNPLSLSSYLIHDTFSFVQDILKLNFNSDNITMASLDIKSLFTNIPIDETINIILDQLFSTNNLFHGFTRIQFKDLLNLTVKNCYFTFNGHYYNQIEGISMGSPLGPLFANIFLSHHEKIWLRNCPPHFKPLYYRRYVDDTFLLFKSKDDILLLPFFELSKFSAQLY